MEFGVGGRETGKRDLEEDEAEEKTKRRKKRREKGRLQMACEAVDGQAISEP